MVDVAEIVDASRFALAVTKQDSSLLNVVATLLEQLMHGPAQKIELDSVTEHFAR